MSLCVLFSDAVYVKKAYELIQASGPAASDGRSRSELCVLCAEQSLQDCLTMYLEGKPPANQFLCRAYLCQGQLISSRSVSTAEDLDKAVMYYLKAIEIARDKSRYNFLVFNASLMYLQSFRRFLRPGQRRHLVSSLMQVIKALEERTEAAAMVKVTCDFMQSHKPELYPRLFSIQRDDATTLKEIFLLLTQSSESRASDLRDSSPPPDIHSSSAPPNTNIVSESTRPSPPPVIQSAPPSIHHSSPPSSSCSSSVCLDHDSSITLTDRVEFLLDLAFLSLQLQQHQTASDCLKELRATNVTVGQRIMTECVQCELELNKHRDGMENYSRSSVELRLSIIVRLDALLQKSAEGGRRSCDSSGVCVSVERILLLDVLCQVHAELAAIDEEDEKLESAMKHLEKALELDPHSQHLSSSLRLLQLRSSVHSTPTRPEEHAAKLIQQAKEGSGRDALRKRRPLLVSAGIALAPDAFQTMTELKIIWHCLLLKHNITAPVCRRVKLWGSLAKTARKQEVFDVCRAACRFCLLYDDGRWKNTSEHKNRASPDQGNQTDPNTQRDLLRLLAEVHFINAERTRVIINWHPIKHSILLPRLSGVSVIQLANKQAAASHLNKYYGASADRQRDWIKDLSAYATGSFLRGAELGAELCEDWLVANAAVYLWNYNNWLLATGGHQLLLPTFRRLVELLRQTGHAGEVVLLVMLCDAVAQGLIQPWFGTSARANQESQDAVKGGVQLPAEKTKKVRGKSVEKSGLTLGPQLDAAAVQDVKKALEVCEFALRLSNGNTEPLPVTVRKQILSTWVCVKQLLQQQIGHKLDINDQMLQCNRNSRLMEFTVPNLSVLYVWTQLALFAHQTHDHDLVLTCTHNALQLEQNATQKEMLSSAACVRGQSLIHEVRGHHSRYMKGLHMLRASVSFAEQAGSWSLCATAAAHYWNACLPLLDTGRDRRQLREELELILKAMSRTYSKHTAVRHHKNTLIINKHHHLMSDFIQMNGKTKGASGLKCDKPVMETPDTASAGSADDDLKVWAAVFNALLHIHADAGDWKKGLQLLDEAVREMPHTEHRLVLLKQRVLVKARLGESVLLDMQRFSDEGEIVCSQMWRRAALCAKDKQQRLNCYQNAITALKSPGGEWQKVDVLLDFGEWLYLTHFPVTDARLHIEWARGVASGPRLSDVGAVGRLERLMRSHTLLALTEERSSPKQQQHLLTAYSCTLHIWKVSMATAQEVMNDSAAPDVRSASSRKDKERPDDKKTKQPSPVEDKPRAKAADVSLPISPEQWAQFECPEEVRQAFLSNSGPYSINSTSIEAQLESFSLTPLTFAPLHLAEVIARDLMKSRSRSDLYHLRIIRNCRDLGFESPYSEQLLSFTHKADVCLSMNLFQPAKVLLTHTHLTAKSLHLLAVLANQEQRYGEALVLLQEAQEIGGDEEFCFLLVQTLLTTVAEQEGPDAHHQVCVITEQACATIRALLEQRPNRASVLRFFIASLQTRAAVSRQRLLSPDGPLCRTTDPSVEMLSSVCDALKHTADELLHLGYRTHAAQATLEHANTLRILAAHASSAEEKQRHLLDAFSLMKTAVSLQEEVVSDVLNVLPPHESGWRNVPAARVCVRLRLALADLALFMLDIQCAEQKRKSIAWDRKSSVERALDDYMRSSADLSQHERVALTHLTAVSSLSLDCVETRAHSLGMMGRCLRILAQQKDPLYPSTLWDEPDTEQDRSERKQNEDDNEDEQMMMNETEKKRYAGKRAELQSERRAAQRLLAQACETLSQSVSLSLQHNLPHLLPHVCSDLLECHGQFDPSASGQYLALLQSGVCCVEMSSVLHSICSSVGESRACALVNLRRKLLSAQGHRPDSTLTAVNRELAALSKKRMSPAEPVLPTRGVRECVRVQTCDQSFSGFSVAVKLSVLSDTTKSTHSVSTICATHTVTEELLLSVLYAGLYERVKSAETQRVKNVTGGLICSKVVKASVHHSDQLQLHKRLQEFKDLNAQLCLKESRHYGQSRALEDKDGKLDECFKALLEEMENYLNPVLSQFDFSCFSVRSPSISTTSARAKDKDEKNADKPLLDAGESVVILADRMLLEFPLEALSVLQVENISSVSRDFSLQVLHTRLQMAEAVESDNKKEAKGGRGVKGRGDQSRGIKAVPVNRVLPPNTVPVDTHKFKYVVDAQEEDDGKQAVLMCESDAPLAVFADLEQLLTSCSAFIYSGMENFFSCVPPAKMASLNMSGCQMVFLFESGQNRVGVQKRCSSGVLEGPVGSAYLFSVSGVHSVLLNQWHSSAAANAQNMRSLMDNLLKAGLTSGRAAHVLRTHKSENTAVSENSSTDESSAANEEDVSSEDTQRKTPLSPSAFNFVIYGLPNLVVT
ncbi:Cilia- and flagella-associated protein 46 [Labeo rohita]|uniref:Cilia- and flagella-associated protein 46 n=1 Tax=Labeo rohita TaxID=84645 RepID=A0ABQ8M5H8_LABRO|nr:Cilia- and flagella-associated protein 46 [Labeo rohita]